VKVCSRARMYYEIGEWSYYEHDRLADKPISRRIARRRLARELRREVADGEG